MNIKIRLILLLPLLIVAMSTKNLLNNTLYVNDAGSGDCSYNNPCTFSYAQNLAVAGDTINVLGKIHAITITKSDITIVGGTVDALGYQAQNSSAVLIGANNVTIRDMEITHSWSSGIRTLSSYGKGTLLENIYVHNNVLENTNSNGSCNGTVSWGGAVRAYLTNGFTIRNSRVWNNCGEGVTSVRSQNVFGENLDIRDNFSVNVYIDQSQFVTITNSTIQCINPAYQRSGLSRSMSLGAESYTGVSTNTESDIHYISNTIYYCKGIGAYTETGNIWNNILIRDNYFYNVPSPIVVSISGNNVITSPNYSYSLTFTTTPNPTATKTLQSITNTATPVLSATFPITLTPSVTQSPTSSLTSTSTNTAIATSTPTVTPTKCKRRKHC